MLAPSLPAEIIDIILEFLFDCPQHRWSDRNTPCAHWHTPSNLPQLLRLRLVNRAFRAHLTPPLFHHLTFKGYHRGQTMSELSRISLSSLVHVLRIEISPKDLGGWSRRVSHSLAAVDQKMLAFFEAMPIHLSPILRRFNKVRTLQIEMNYAGFYEKRIPTNEKLGGALEALAKAVKRARLAELRDLTLGVPYEGGYTNFFKDLDDDKYKRMLRGVGKSLTSASVKLFDKQGQLRERFYESFGTRLWQSLEFLCSEGTSPFILGYPKGLQGSARPR